MCQATPYSPLVIGSWRHKGLKELFETGTSAKVRSDQHKRCLRILDALNVATRPEDMNVPGWRFHQLSTGRYAVSVNGPWRITFGWEGTNAEAVDLEQYH